MKKMLLVLTVLFLAGCTTLPAKPIYQKIDTTIIIVPKTQESKIITITYTKVEADGKINKITKDITIPNIYYPDDDAVISSKSKWNQDIGNSITTVETTKK
jgi:uncharacterized lipoprotein YmbA